jgi:WD40 repeat protein
VVQINPDTGLLNTIGQSGFPNLNSLARNYEGKLYAVGGADFNQLIRISRITGAGTLVTTLDFGDTPDVRGLAFIGESLFATNCRPDSSLFDLFRIDLATGIGTRINPEDSPLPRLQGLTSSGWGVLYGWDAATNGLIWINKDTGAFAYVNPGMTGPSGIQSIAFSADGNLYGIGQVSGGNTKLYLIDSLTGASSLVGDTGGKYDVRGLEFVPPVKLKVPLAAIHLLLLHDLKEGPPWPPVDK